MSQHYLFHEAGCIPGVPGTFANVRVDLDDDGAISSITPLVPGDFTYSGEIPVTVQVVEEAPVVQEDARAFVAPEPEQQAEPAPVEEPAPEPTSEPTSPPAFNGG